MNDVIKVLNIARKAEKRGEKEGRKIQAIETAEKAIKKGFGLEDIMELTGLTEREIQKIKNKKV